MDFELDTCSRDLNSDFTLKNCLIGGVKLAKKADPDKQIYTGYGIGFDSRLEFLLRDGSVGKNGIIFGVDMDSLMNIDHKKRNVLFVSKGPAQKLDDTALIAEPRYLINFSKSNRKFCLTLHYIGRNSFIFVNATKTY